MSRAFKPISSRERKRIMRDAFVELAVREVELETVINRARKAFERAIKPQRRQLAEVKARIAQIERERDRE